MPTRILLTAYETDILKLKQTNKMTLLKYLLRIIIISWKASVWDYPYWRVTYKDGKRTRLLYYREAIGLKDVFDGRMWIDFNCK